MKKYWLLCFFIFGIVVSGFSQYCKIRGKLSDSTNDSPLPGANLILKNKEDSAKKFGTVSDANGIFYFNDIPLGTYNLKITFIGYKSYTTDVNADNPFVKVGIIKLQPESKILKDVNVQDKQIRAQQIGDTTQYNADAFKTKPDATAEDLVQKMPGVTIDNSGIKVQNENVKQVLVDGKPFFGEDPSLALKSIPAEVIEKIQVFDKLSDHAQFTGFDDGNSAKTMNLITRQGKNNGQFGKVYAGYGTDDRYLAGGNINYFKDDRRVTLIGMANNVNQQNFSMQDLLGAQGAGFPGAGMMRGMQRGGRSGGGPGGGGSDNFFVDQQSGITATNSIGSNYSDNWGKKIKISASYFFIMSDNDKNTTLLRNYLYPDTGQLYNELNHSQSKNYNHRLNVRFEYSIDSLNSILISPRIYYQDNSSGNTVNGTYLFLTQLLDSAYNNYNSNNAGYNFSNNLLLRHKFAKKGRTVSLNLNTDINDKSGGSGLQSQNFFYVPPGPVIESDQKTNTSSNSYLVNPNITYTEPLGENAQLQFSYSPTYTNSISDKSTYNKDLTSQQYTLVDTTLSNVFSGIYKTHKGGASYRYRKKTLNFSAGVNYQYTELTGEQTFPGNDDLKRTFSAILPNAQMSMRFSQTSNLRINYRTSGNAPSVAQLQDVLDKSNSMMLSSGNPDMKQEYRHTLMGNYGISNTGKGRTFMVFFFTNYIRDYIGNSVIHATHDTTLENNVHLFQGAQYSKPVNLDRNLNLRSFLTYGLTLDSIKCNVNLHTGFMYSNTPGLVNNLKNLANNYTISQGLVISSNISEKIDFTVSYTANYNIVKNSIQSENNNNYFSQTATAKFNWIFWKGIVLSGDATHYLYRGLTQDYNLDFFLLNAGIGKKLFKNQNGEIKLTAFDILNQNKSISRSVTDSYIEDSNTKILRKYFMLTFTYILKGTQPPPDKNRERFRDFRPPHD
ncbi:MAG: TonB-dependent receptor [Bacteroidia bacterium]|nr:TonB-dependent receptor [Bacteroidia bacterium]